MTTSIALDYVEEFSVRHRRLFCVLTGLRSINPSYPTLSANTRPANTLSVVLLL